MGYVGLALATGPLLKKIVAALLPTRAPSLVAKYFSPRILYTLFGKRPKIWKNENVKKVH